MDDQSNKYETLISKLQATKPLIENPELLTDSVIRKIQSNEPDNTKGKTLFLIRLISTAAAVLFLGLYLVQSTENYNKSETDNNSQLLSIKLLRTEYCGSFSNSIKGNKNDLFAQYMCYMQKNTNENKIFNQYFQKQNPDRN
jgi:hypothetical protein